MSSKSTGPTSPVIETSANLPQSDLLPMELPLTEYAVVSHAKTSALQERGGGLAGERSGLFFEVARLISELRPRFVILENVGALLCRGLDAVLGTLAQIGYDAIWHCIPASHVGLPHRRDRVWIIAYPRQERTEGRWQNAFSRLYGISWSENVRRAADWARRSDLSASGLCRGSDGIPNRVDRTSALGNAVVPQIPELIGRAILEAHVAE